MYFLKFCKLTSVSLLAAAMSVGLSIPAQALSFVKENLPVVHVFGSELSVVRFQQGEFRNRGNGQWDEISSKTNQVTFRFIAQSATTNYVTLFDASRNVTLVLDINLGQILFTVGTPTFRPLYTITTFEFARRLPAGQSSTPIEPVAPPKPVAPQVYTPSGDTGGGVDGGATPPPADERKWQHFSSRSQGRRVHRLNYGIPETDAVTFRASCVRGSGAPRFIIAANVGNQSNGAGANVAFRANGFAKRYGGRVAGAGNTQEGIAGIRVSLGANDPLWSALARKNSISYTAFGQRRTMSLSGSSRAVNAFLAGCRPKPVVQQPRPGDNPQPPITNAGGGEISCNRFGRIKSRNTNRRTRVTFVNKSGRRRDVMWINYQGIPQLYGTIPAGQSRSFSTFVGHPWMTVNGPGNCKQLFLPRPASSRFVLRR